MSPENEAELRRQIVELERSNTTLAAALEIERRRSVDAEAKLRALKGVGTVADTVDPKLP